MKLRQQILMIYFVVTITLPIILFYPTLIHSDLSGMGGYEGFASPTMMVEHGVWASTANGHTSIYYLFQSISLLWLASLVNLIIGMVIFVNRFIRRKPNRT